MFPPHKSHLKSYYRAIKSAEEIGLRDMGMWPLHNLPPGHASQGPTMSDAISNLESKLQQHSSLSDMRKKIAPKQASKLSDNSAIEYHACVCGMLTAAPRQESFTPAPPTATTGSDQAYAICFKQEAEAAFPSTILAPPPRPRNVEVATGACAVPTCASDTQQPVSCLSATSTPAPSCACSSIDTGLPARQHQGSDQGGGCCTAS